MAKRISSSSVNWSRIGELLSQEEKAVFVSFKAKTDKYLRQVVSQPAELPKIDWNHYKSKITTPGLVDSFQKKYETLKIPYPSDQGFLAKIDTEEKKNKELWKKNDDNVVKTMAELKTKLQELEKVLPYSEMSLEELFIARPDMAVTPEKPSYFPHYIIGPNEKEEIIKKSH